MSQLAQHEQLAAEAEIRRAYPLLFDPAIQELIDGEGQAHPDAEEAGTGTGGSTLRRTWLRIRAARAAHRP